MDVSICEKCEEFACVVVDGGPLRFYHLPDVFSLLESTKSCSFCEFLIDQLGEQAVERMKDHARKGSHTRVVLKTTMWGDHVHLKLAFEYICEIWSKYGVVETRPFLLCTSKGNALQRAYWKSSTEISFQMKIPTILSWLEECEKTHSGCNAAEGAHRFQLPQRMIHVGSTTDFNSLHLVNREDQFDYSTKYIALSHCWGSAGVSLKTSRDNLPSFMRNIAVADMPNTFRDIISIARGLGISYVWIDSLCIIQDDPEDWQREAAKMATIFHYSYLTVSAAASDCHGGCGLSKLDQPAFQFYLPNTSSVGITLAREKEANPRFSVRVSQNYRVWNPPDDFKEWPLHKRGWIFQEIILSCRLLHVDPNGNIFWQCHTILESEDGAMRHINQPQKASEKVQTQHLSLIDAPLDGFREIAREQDDIRAWWRLLKEFFRRKFTVPEDDLPAMLGTVILYENLTGDIPVVGLWRKKLQFHIAWRVISPEGCQRNWDYPSWSWASFINESRRQLDLPEYRPYKIIWEVEVVDFDIEWKAAPYMSSLHAAVIRIRRHRLTDLWKEHMKGSSVYWDSQESLREYELLLGPEFVGYTPPSNFLGREADYRLVFYEEKEPLRRIWLGNQEYLPLWVTHDSSDSAKEQTAIVHVLMLKQTNSGQYRRDAYVEFWFNFERTEDSHALIQSCFNEFDDVIELV